MYNKMVATLNTMNKSAATERYLIIIHKLSYESKLISLEHLIKPIHCFEINCLIYMDLARIKMVFKT